MTVTVLPLTADLWDAFEELFGPQGACDDCWCTYFRVPKAARRLAGPAERRGFMLDRVRRGPPPGLLALESGKALGWMQIGPRADVPVWNGGRRASAAVDPGDADDPAIWAISCFFVSKAARGQGLSHGLVSHGIDHARRHGARQVEACPRDRGTDPRGADLFVGLTHVFQKAGFRRVAERRAGRPLMRYVI